MKPAAPGPLAARTAATPPDGARLLRLVRAARAALVPRVPAPDAFALPGFLPARPRTAGIRPRLPRPPAPGGLRDGRPGTHRVFPASPAGRFRFRFRTASPTGFPVDRTTPVDAPVISLPFLPRGPFFLLRDFGRPNAPRSPIRPHAAFSAPFGIRLPRSFAEPVPDEPEALASGGGVNPVRIRCRPRFRSSSASRRSRIGRYGGPFRGDDDSRADLLRTRTATTRPRPRRR
jgi:hypothetical protein